MIDILQELLEARRAGRSCALATVVATMTSIARFSLPRCSEADSATSA
jgi:hypothetical protein